MVMTTSRERPGTIIATPDEALNELHRKLVASHYGLAEHGPSDPKMAVPWALDELRSALDYIQAVRTAQPAQSNAG